MLIDFPVVKKEIGDILMKRFSNSAEKELGSLSRIGRQRQHEGDKHSYSTIDGRVKDIGYQELGVEYQITLTDIPSMEIGDVLSLIEQKGKEMGGKMARSIYKTITEVTEEEGNVVHGGEKPLSLELIIKALEKIEIAFDEEGNPQMPSMHIHPNMTPKIKELIEKGKVDKKYERQMKELIERKRKEWNDKQNNRKLVD